MEKSINQEERIRRAEQIYNKRKNNVYIESESVNRFEKSDNKKRRITKKMLLQFIICGVIYFAIYIMLNSNYFMSNELHSKIDDFLSYDMQFSNIYNNVMGYIKNDDNIINKIFINKNETDSEEDSQNMQNETEGNEIQAVGGAEDLTQVAEDKSQEDIDIEYIKQNYNIIWPLKGEITSGYGTREASNIITANHYGIDIAGNSGENIIAAMDGTVTIASEEGEYGKHIQITNGEVQNLYAHCSKLLVSNGENIKQGSIIAQVGQTRKSYRSSFAF